MKEILKNKGWNCTVNHQGHPCTCTYGEAISETQKQDLNLCPKHGMPNLCVMCHPIVASAPKEKQDLMPCPELECCELKADGEVCHCKCQKLLDEARAEIERLESLNKQHELILTLEDKVVAEIIQTKDARIKELVGALDKVEYKQTEIISMLRKNGFVFDNKGGRWEKLAFTLYTDICELRQLAKEALKGKSK